MSKQEDVATIVQSGFPANGYGETGRVFTVPWREGNPVATVIGEGVRGNLYYPKKGPVASGTSGGFMPTERYVVLWFPDTQERVEVPLAWMPPKGAS